MTTVSLRIEGTRSYRPSNPPLHHVWKRLSVRKWNLIGFSCAHSGRGIQGVEAVEVEHSSPEDLKKTREIVDGSTHVKEKQAQFCLFSGKNCKHRLCTDRHQDDETVFAADVHLVEVAPS